METTEPTITGERDNLASRAVHLRSRLENRLHELGRRVEDTKQALDLARIVRDRPLASVGAAFAAGALIGLVFSGKGGKVTGMVGTLITGTALQFARNWISTQLGGAMSPTSAPAA